MDDLSFFVSSFFIVFVWKYFINFVDLRCQRFWLSIWWCHVVHFVMSWFKYVCVCVCVCICVLVRSAGEYQEIHNWNCSLLSLLNQQSTEKTRLWNIFIGRSTMTCSWRMFSVDASCGHHHGESHPLKGILSVYCIIFLQFARLFPVESGRPANNSSTRPNRIIHPMLFGWIQWANENRTKLQIISLLRWHLRNVAYDNARSDETKRHQGATESKEGKKEKFLSFTKYDK